MKKSIFAVLVLTALMASQVSAIACGVEGGTKDGDGTEASETE